MPPFGPVSRRNLIRALQQAGFRGPFAGKRHEFMIRGLVRLPIPNPHPSDIRMSLLANILRQAGITRAEWEKL